MKHGLLTVLLVACATTVSAGEDSVQEKIIEDALLPLPAASRDGAEVAPYDAAWNRTVLREGTNSIRSQAAGSATLSPNHSAQCFHESWEPSWVRVFQLLAEGMPGDEAPKTIFAEIDEGKLEGPDAGSVVFEIDKSGMRAQMGVSAPGATAESTGLSTKRDVYRPWLMLEGTPWAHVHIPGK